MALARAAAGQVQLGDDDDREARRAAVIAEMDSRLATVGEITRRVHSAARNLEGGRVQL